jgi:hypothetical protein
LPGIFLNPSSIDDGFFYCFKQSVPMNMISESPVDAK